MTNETVDWDARRKSARRTAVIMALVAAAILVGFIAVQVLPSS